MNCTPTREFILYRGQKNGTIECPIPICMGDFDATRIKWEKSGSNLRRTTGKNKDGRIEIQITSNGGAEDVPYGAS